MKLMCLSNRIECPNDEAWSKHSATTLHSWHPANIGAMNEYLGEGVLILFN